MYLHYDPNTQLFSLSDNGENEIVFETYTKEECVGKIKGVNPPIEIQVTGKMYIELFT